MLIGPGARHAPPGALTAFVLLASALLALGFLRAQTPERGRVGVDLYQYWGVGQVVRLSDGAVRNPYRQQPDFSRLLGQRSRSSDDPMLHWLGTRRADLELQATPASYLLFSLWPDDYRDALEVHRALQVAAFLLAVALCVGFAGGLARVAWSLAVACLLVPVFQPFQSDMRVGNYSSFLLLGLAIAIALARHRKGANGRGRRLTGAGALAVVGGLALVKPSLAPASVALGLLLVARWGLRGGWPPILAGSVAIGMLACLPMLYFGTAAIWSDWLHYFHTGNLDMHTLPFEEGNLSVPLALAGLLDSSTGAIAGALAIVLAATLALAALPRGRPLETLRSVLADPACAVAIGVAAFFAISPLAWVHYHLLLLAPALAIIGNADARGIPAVLSLVAIVLAGNEPVIMLASFVEDDERRLLLTGAYGTMVAWPTLWLALLAMTLRLGGAPPSQEQAAQSPADGH